MRPSRTWQRPTRRAAKRKCSCARCWRRGALTWRDVLRVGERGRSEHDDQRELSDLKPGIELEGVVTNMGAATTREALLPPRNSQTQRAISQNPSANLLDKSRSPRN